MKITNRATKGRRNSRRIIEERDRSVRKGSDSSTFPRIANSRIYDTRVDARRSTGVTGYIFASPVAERVMCARRKVSSLALAVAAFRFE